MSKSRVCKCPDKEKYCKEACPCCYEELLEEVQRLLAIAWGRKLMLRNFFNMGQPIWVGMIQLGRYDRAGGDVICQTCGMKLFEHPEIKDFPTFVVSCEGKVLKL